MNKQYTYYIDVKQAKLFRDNTIKNNLFPSKILNLFIKIYNDNPPYALYTLLRIDKNNRVKKDNIKV
jgi:hypothetical protein